MIFNGDVMAKVSLTIELEFDENIYRESLRNHLLGDDLILYSKLIGDKVGSVRILSINEGKEPDYHSDKIAWIKWYRKNHGCDLKTAVDAGKELFT